MNIFIKFRNAKLCKNCLRFCLTAVLFATQDVAKNRILFRKLRLLLQISDRYTLALYNLSGIGFLQSRNNF